MTRRPRRGPTPEVSLATLEAEFQRYRQGYKRHTLLCLQRRSRCISSFTAGPSKFPTHRAEKANTAEQRAVLRMTEFRVRALAAIGKAIRPDLSPIMAGDSNATQRLKEKLAKAEALQVTMRTANAAIRKHAKEGKPAQVAALVALELPESIARDLLEPDFAGRIGFADYQTKNNGAEIRRIKARLGQVETAQATPATEAEGTNARLEDVPAENRVRLFFPGKPAEEVRSRLKASGFRWTPTLGCWQAYRNHHSLSTARAEAGVLSDMKDAAEK